MTTAVVDNSIGLTRLQMQCDRLGKYFAVSMAFFIPISSTGTTISFACALICQLLSGRVREKCGVIFSLPIIRIFTILFLMTLVGCFYSTGTPQDMMAVVKRYAHYPLIAFLMPYWTDGKWRTRAIQAFLSAMIVTLVLSYMQTFHLIPSLHRIKDSGSVFKSYIQTSFAMSLAIYFIIIQSILTRSIRWHTVLLLLLMCVDVLFISNGRTGYIVFMSLVALLGWQVKRWSGVILSSLIIAVLFSSMYFFSSHFSNRVDIVVKETKVQQMKVHEDMSIGLRRVFAAKTLHMLKEHPFLGAGTGSIKTEMSKIEPTQIQNRNPHNEYLNLGAQFGIGGILLLLALYFYAWKMSWQLPVGPRWMIQGAVLAFAIGSLANSWLMNTTEGYFLAYLLVLGQGITFSTKRGFVA